MSRRTRWLLDEIETWRLESLISDQQATQLSERYAVPGTPWGRIIFAAIGLVIAGLGVILLLAYNWEDMHRFTKLALVVASVLLAHGAGLYVSRRTDLDPRFAESLHILGTMLFGAGIWLVAQIYHINEHYPNAFLVWSLGALAIAWCLPSLAHALLALGLITVWHLLEVFDFGAPNHAAPLIITSIVPLAWYLRSGLAFTAATILLLVSYTVTYLQVLGHQGETVFAMLIALSAALVFGGAVVRQNPYFDAPQILQGIGLVMLAGLVFMCSFHGMDGLRFSDTASFTILVGVYFLLPLALALASLGWLLSQWSRLGLRLPDVVLIVLAATAVLLSQLTAFDFWGLADGGWILYNLLALGLAVLLLYRGSHDVSARDTGLGSILLAAFIFARFMDLFDSLLLRGLAFIVIGVGLASIGWYFSRRRQETAGGRPGLDEGSAPS